MLSRKTSLVFDFIIFLLLCNVNDNDCLNSNTYELYDRHPVQIPAIAGENYTFFVNPSMQQLVLHASHIVFQAHAHQYNVSIIFNSSTSANDQNAIGSNVGVVSVLGRDSSQWMMTVLATPGMVVNVLVAAIVYNRSDPIPGGCNLDLPLENDPNIYLTNVNQQSQLQYAYSNANRRLACGKFGQQHMEYIVYQFFMDERHRDEENYLSSLKKMITVDDIANTADKITFLSSTGKMSVNFAAYSGQGVIYAVIARTTDDNGAVRGTAAYVPAVTYACRDEACTEPGDLPAKIVVVTLGVIGLVMCFFGHRLIVLEMFFFGFLAAQLTAIILLMRYTSCVLPNCLYISLGIGGFGGLTWMVLWIFFGNPVVSVLLVGFELGYIIACVLYIMTPLALNWWILVEYVYQLTFFSTVIIVNVILLAATRFLNVLSCSVIGSYLVVLAIDWFLQGGVRQLILNSIRKSAIPGFTGAFCSAPFQFSDIGLCCLWVLLAIIGVIVQLVRERGRPDFPPCPWNQYRLRREYDGGRSDGSEVLVRPRLSRFWQRRSRRSNVDGEFDEVDPLLGGQRRPATDMPYGRQVWQPNEPMWQPNTDEVTAPPAYSTISQPT